MSHEVQTALSSLEAMLQSMVRLHTVNSVVSGDPLTEQKQVEHNERLAQALGFTTRRLPIAGRADNLLVTLEIDPALPWLLFESHMDTVAIDGMTIDPLAAELRDGRIWGRGSCDTKGTGAAMLWAMKQYALQAGPHPCNAALLFAIDEEFGMTGVRAFIHQHLPTLSWRPIGVIVGEPTNCQPIVAHNGCVRWSITTTGTAAHSADPSKGHSAISDCAAVIAAIERDYIPQLTTRHALTGKAQASINLIRGGTQINIIPESCSIQLDRRVVPGEDPSTVLPTVHGVLDQLKTQHPRLNAKQEVIFQCPPLAPQPNDPLLPIVQQALGDMKLPTAPLGVPYATDAGDLSAAGIPTVVIGPGDIAQAHTKDEWLEVAALHQGAAVYLAILNAVR